MPPLLRVVSIVGLLLALAALVLLMLGFLSLLEWLSRDWGFDHVLAVALNLIMLSVSCSFAVDTFCMRFRRPGGGPFPLDSWQSQLRALLLAAALPLCALPLAIVISPARPGYSYVLYFTILALLVSYGANLWLFGRHQAAEQRSSSPGLAALAAVSLAGWLALYGLFWYIPQYSCGEALCGLGLLGYAYLFVGTGALLGFAAWLGATLRAVWQHEVLSALSIGLLLPVALVNALFFLNNHAIGSVGYGGSWALFSVVSATLLATSVTRRQTTRRVVAVAGLVLAVALLVASKLVDYYSVT